MDQSQPIYFHVDFLKPGKNTYLVEHCRKEEVKNDFFNIMALGDDFDDKSALKNKKLYVH